MKHAMGGGGGVGGWMWRFSALGAGMGTRRQSLPQCLGKGVLIPNWQVWGWRHAVLGITWTPGETEMIKMTNPVVSLTFQYYLPEQ